MTYEVVERPAGGRGGSGGTITEELIEALRKTKAVEDGKETAIVVQLEPETNFINWQSNVRNRLRKENLKLHARIDKSTKKVTCWVEDADD